MAEILRKKAIMKGIIRKLHEGLSVKEAKDRLNLWQEKMI